MVASEAVSNIRTIAAFSSEDKVLGLFAAQLAAPMRKAAVRGIVSGFVYGISQVGGGVLGRFLEGFWKVGFFFFFFLNF